MSEADVLVIGGGVIGMCTAYYLARSGAAVTVLEEHQVGGPMASSYGNIGLLVPSHSTPVAEPRVISRGLRWLLDAESPLYIKPRWDADLLRWLLRFRAACAAQRCAAAEPVVYRWQRASLELYAELAAELPPEVDYERKGGLFLYREQHAWEEAAAAARREQEAGIDVALVEREQLGVLVPGLKEGVVGALHYRQDARLIPDAFVRALAAAAARYGATVHEHASVFALERRGAGVAAVRTSRGTLRPRLVVLATGFLSPRLGRDVGLRVPVQPAKGYSITVRRPATCPEIPLHFHEERVVLTPVRPRPDAHRRHPGAGWQRSQREPAPAGRDPPRAAALPRWHGGVGHPGNLARDAPSVGGLAANPRPPARPRQPAAGYRSRHDRDIAGTGQR